MADPGKILRGWLGDERERVMQEQRSRDLMLRTALNVEGALAELSIKDRNAIETEAAVRWASLAIAAYTMGVRSPDKASQILRFSEGDDYSSEAREHASLVADGGKLLAYVVREMEDARRQALGVAINGS